MHLANQCCGFEMFIVDPGSWVSPSWIPDPKTTSSIVVNYFIFEQVQKKSSQFTKNFCTFPGSARLGQTNFRLAYLCDRMREIRMVSRFWSRMFQMNPYFRLGRCKFAARHRPLPTLNNLPSPARTIYPLNNWIFFPASKYTVITKN